MTGRITNDDLENGLVRLDYALSAHGRAPAWDRVIALARPYGQIYYVVTHHIDGGDLRHDVPGFLGSGGSGFTSKREAHDAIWQTARVLFDLANGSEEVV